MITLRYYLDTRKPPRKMDGRWPLKLVVCKRGQTAMMSVAVFLTREEWDVEGQRVKRAHPQRAAINNYLDQLRIRMEEQLRALILAGDAAPMTAGQIRDWIQERTLATKPGVTLADYYQQIRSEKTGRTSTLFLNAWRTFVRLEPRVATIPLSGLTADLVKRIDRKLVAQYAPNTRNVYITKLMQVSKRAHREGLLPDDPGRVVRLQYVIPRSRALTVEQLRILFFAEPTAPREREALDLFKLSFYLRGMNGIDISKATPGDIFNGRILYERSKTSRGYSVKVEPEAAEIIARYQDGEHLFAPLARFTNYQNYIQDVNDWLRTYCKAHGLPDGVTMYWARHTFASLVIETGGTMEILAGALGHSYGPKITAGYVTIQQRQVDEAVRRVFDYVAGE